MDMKISGTGVIGAGEYDDIRISGSAKLCGNIRCKNFHCSGAVHSQGKVESAEVHVSGSAKFDDSIYAENIDVSGSIKAEKNCISSGDLRISGAVSCGGDVKGNKIVISGSARITNLEGEDVLISGKIVCSDLLNAEKLTIKMNGASSEIGSIGGSQISIYPERYHKPLSRMPLLSRLLNNNGHNDLVVNESIEGDEIALELVRAKTVIGRVVAIGAGCHIGLVQYSERIEISPDAKVDKQERIS